MKLSIGLITYNEEKNIARTLDSRMEIANEIGYENPSKFSEAFKSYFEILPREYRKNHKK